MPFQLKHFASYGSSHPVPARIFLQMDDLLQATDLDEGRKERTREYLFRCSDQLVRAEQKKDAFLRSCASFMESVKSGRAFSTQPHAIEIHEPENLGDEYELFFIRLATALRMAVGAAGLILEGEPLKWRQFESKVKQRFPDEGHPVRMALSSHSGWTADLFEARGEIEHDPFLFQGFTIESGASDLVLELQPPRMASGESAIEAVRRLYQNGFAFAEDLVVCAIETRLPSFVMLIEVPETQRDKAKPVRFRLGLREGVLPP